MINVKFFKRTGEYLYTLPCTSLAISHELNAVGTFDFKLGSEHLNGHSFDRLVRMRVIVQVDGSTRASGYVHSLAAADGQYTVRCNTLMDELTRIRSKSDAAYQDQQLIAILLDLLTYAPEWTLGDITSMPDPLVRTTVDLRGEKRLYNQIIRLLESVPSIYLREALGRTLDIGQFNFNAHPRLTDVENLSVETKYVDVVEQIEPYGGEVTFTETYTEIELQEQIKYSEDPELDPDTPSETIWVEVPVERTRSIPKTINLEDALEHSPALAVHTQFPIVLSNGVYVVRNIRDAGVAGMGEYTDVYQEIVPPTRENPTEDEVRQAGYALWYKTVRELDARRDNAETWSCRVRSVPDDFKVGDRLYIHSEGRRTYRDPLSGTVVHLPLESVSRWFRVPRYSVTYDDDGAMYDIELADHLDVAAIDPFLALYESAAGSPNSTFSGRSLVLSSYSILSATLPTGNAPDCFNRDDVGFFEGRTVTLPLETPPAGSASMTVYGTPFTTQYGATLRLVTTPELPAQPAVVCVSINRGWNINNSATIYLLVKYE